MPPPPAAVAHPATAAGPAATAGVQGSDAKSLPVLAAPKPLDEPGLADPAAAVSTPAKLVLPQAAAGRKLRAAAASQPPVRHSVCAV